MLNGLLELENPLGTYVITHMIIWSSNVRHHQMLPRCSPEAVPGKGLDLALADRR